MANWVDYKGYFGPDRRNARAARQAQTKAETLRLFLARVRADSA